MVEVFKTVIILSILGFVLTVILLCLKPITAKKFPAKWQYCVWIAVLLTMIIPIYRLIPAKDVQKLPFISRNYVVQTETVENLEEAPRMVVIEETPDEHSNVNAKPKLHINYLSYLWLVGMCIYLLVIICSYVVYVIRKRKNAVLIRENKILNDVKKQLNIKRYIKIKMSDDIQSPMLVGVFFPAIYIPCRDIPEENMRMVFLHELTHYKRKDLIIKWLSVFVNAVHWFNPLVYLLFANISEACEISCDMAVTKNMSDTEQKIYMNTILDLAQ